jgi:hypothetical protein
MPKPELLANKPESPIASRGGWDVLEVSDALEPSASQRIEEAVAKLTVQHNRATQKYIDTKNTDEITALYCLKREVLTSMREADIETVDLSLMSEAFKAVRRFDNHVANIPDPYWLNGEEEIQGALGAIPADILQAMVRSPKDSEGGAVRYALKELVRSVKKESGTIPFSALHVITRAYGIESSDSFAAMYPQDAQAKNEILEFMRDNPIFLILKDLQVEMEQASTQDEEMAIAKNFSREYLAGLGMNDEFVDRAVHAMRGRISIQSRPESGVRDIVSSLSVTEELVGFSEQVQALGIEGVRALAEEAGIVNFSNFTLDQLQTTLGLIQGDQKVIDRLRDGDCAVMVLDGTEDWNGAFRGVGKLFSGDAGKVVVFELSSMADDAEELSKRVSLLEDNGVKASTLVIGGHGRPGGIHIGDGYLGYRSGPDLPGVVSVAQSVTMKRLFGRLKPSTETGRASIIIKSCSQASSETAKKVSTAMRMAREAGRKGDVPVSVYAAEVPTYMKRINTLAMQYGEGVSAVKLSVDDNAGLPTRSRVSQIPLDAAFRRDDNEPVSKGSS